MLALPHVSGTECIEVLERLGYRPQRRAGGLASLRRDANVVVVPESATLSPAVIGAILRSANVDPLDFIRVLEEYGPTPSRAPPRVA
jgi:predicted RNA binding protein YcfA (HicA-like mRNA interferase family)